MLVLIALGQHQACAGELSADRYLVAVCLSRRAQAFHTIFITDIQLLSLLQVRRCLAHPQRAHAVALFAFFGHDVMFCVQQNPDCLEF